MGLCSWSTFSITAEVRSQFPIFGFRSQWRQGVTLSQAMPSVSQPETRRVSVLTEQAHALVDQLAKALELVGVAIILGGIILSTVAFLRDGWRTSGWRSVYPRYRSDIGRGILLGLELLVGADIISTITAPLTFESVGLLAAVVAIRTFLSFSLETEIDGCWPWQRAIRDAGMQSGIEPDRR
jgi:uncharacterized membrane protein